MVGKIVLNCGFRRSTTSSTELNAISRGRFWGKLKEREKKSNVKWKLANIVIREAVKHGYAVILKKLGENSTKNMVARIRDGQHKHRIYQASFRDIQRAI
ncbi:MAG: hypothetical protein QXI35_08150 [Candidatus Nezhaarchaeales archaeon]